MKPISRTSSADALTIQEGDRVVLNADHAHGYQTLKKGSKGHVVDVGESPLDHKTYLMVEFTKHQAVVGLRPIDVTKVSFPKT